MSLYQGPEHPGDSSTQLSLPPAEEKHRAHVLKWCEEAVREGEDFLRAQFGYDKIEETIQAIMGEHDLRLRSKDLSSTASNRVGKIALDLAAGLTDTKNFWEYRTNNKRYENTAQIFNKLALHFWTNRKADMHFCDGIKYYLAAGTGWLHHYLDPTEMDISLTAEDPRDVLPIRAAANDTIQTAFGVIIRRQRPTNYLKARYPNLASYIVADREGSWSRNRSQTRAGRLLSKLSAGLSPFADTLFGGTAAQQMVIPTTDVFNIYVNDDSVNKSSQPVYVGNFDRSGRPLNNWSYVVPPGGKLYPRKRSIVCTRTAILYDGPNMFWHGLFPVNKLTIDPWPWTWLGKSPLWDLLAMESGRNSQFRVIEDHNNQLASPALIGDKNSMAKLDMENINTRRAGLKVRYNPVAGKGFQVVYPQALEPTVLQYIDLLTNEMEFVSGVRDIMNLTKLGQIPASETIEKITESMSPAIRLRSRVIEAVIREFAQMAMINFMQFYDLPRRISLLGADGATFEDFDFDPATIVPDYVDTEDFSAEGSPTEKARLRGPRARMERARTFMQYFTFHIAPGSLLSASEVSRKLMYLTLSRAGLVDHWTLLETLGVPNVGEPPEGARTITDRLVMEQGMGLGMNISAVGRKATGQTMPRITTKES